MKDKLKIPWTAEQIRTFIEKNREDFKIWQKKHQALKDRHHKNSL